MKRSIIHYRMLGYHKVELIKFECIAAPLEIQKEFGKAVYEEYFKNTVPRYSRFTRDMFVIRFNATANPHAFKVGQVITTLKFERLVRAMKQAGNHLARLREEKKYKVQQVVI